MSEQGSYFRHSPVFHKHSIKLTALNWKHFGSTNQGEEPAVAPIRVEEAERGNKRSYHTCDLCDKVIIGDLDWTGEAVDQHHTISTCILVLILFY